jgi:hypothetical protein
VGASEDGLVADGDLPAPVQPDGSGAYFQVAEGAATELSADFHPLASTVWKLTVAVPPTVRRGTWQVTWDGTGLPSVGDALLMPCTAAWETSGEKIDLRTAGTLNVTNDGVDVLAFHFLVVVSERVDVTYNLSDGWNLIGVPLDADADSIAAFLADQAVWTVYGWTEAGGYTVASTLKPGRGYWVYVLGDDVTLTLSGIPQVGGVALTAGWNLVSLGGDGTQDPRGAYEAVLSSWLWNPASLRYSAPPQGGIPATSGVWVLVDEDTVIWSNR